MAEMTAAQAVFVLNKSTILSNNIKKQIAALIEQQAAQLESIKTLLPDNYSQSKDWQASNIISRIDWLKVMFENNKAEIERLEQLIEQQVG